MTTFSRKRTKGFFLPLFISTFIIFLLLSPFAYAEKGDCLLRVPLQSYNEDFNSRPSTALELTSNDRIVDVSSISDKARRKIEKALKVWELERNSSRPELIDAYYDIAKEIIDNGLGDYVKGLLDEGYEIAFWPLPRSGALWATIWIQVITDKFKDMYWRIDRVLKEENEKEIVIKSRKKNSKGHIVFVMDSVVNSGSTIEAALRDLYYKAEVPPEDVVIATLFISPESREIIDNSGIRRCYTGMALSRKPIDVLGDVGNRLFGPSLEEWFLEGFKNQEEIKLSGVRYIDMKGSAFLSDTYLTQQLDPRSFRVLVASIKDRLYSLRMWVGMDGLKIWKSIGGLNKRKGAELHIAAPVCYSYEYGLLAQKLILGRSFERVLQDFKEAVDRGEPRAAFNEFVNIIKGLRGLIDTLKTLKDNELSYFSIHPANIRVANDGTFYLTSIIYPYRKSPLKETELVQGLSLLLEYAIEKALGIEGRIGFSKEAAVAIDETTGFSIMQEIYGLTHSKNLTLPEFRKQVDDIIDLINKEDSGKLMKLFPERPPVSVPSFSNTVDTRL